MRTKLKVFGAIVCILSILSSGIGAFAAGYDVLCETTIEYQKDDATDEYGYGMIHYSTLISNFSNGFSVVYENCKELRDMVYYTTVNSSYLIDITGNKVNIGDYDMVGIAPQPQDEFSVEYVLPGRNTYFDFRFPNGVDLYGGVNVSKNGKTGYLGLTDGIQIPCEHNGAIFRYDENVFCVVPGYYPGEAEYFINASGEKLLQNIDLSIVNDGTHIYNPSLKYLGDNIFQYTFGYDYENNQSLIKYIDINGNEIQGYTPIADETELYSIFISNYNFMNGNNDVFIKADTNGKLGLINDDESLIVPCVYDGISGLQNGYCWAVKDGKWSLLQIYIDDVTVKVDNEDVVFDQIPLIINGRTLAPLRAIFEKLGATVEWNGETQTITSTKGDTVITMNIDKNEMYKNGEMIWLDVAPQIVGERTLVPVRAIAEAFNCDVTWDGENHTVNIAK